MTTPNKTAQEQVDELSRQLAENHAKLKDMTTPKMREQIERITANARRLYHHYSQPNADKSRITVDLSRIIQSLEQLAARAALWEGA